MRQRSTRWPCGKLNGQQHSRVLDLAKIWLSAFCSFNQILALRFPVGHASISTGVSAPFLMPRAESRCNHAADEGQSGGGSRGGSRISKLASRSTYPENIGSADRHQMEKRLFAMRQVKQELRKLGCNDWQLDFAGRLVAIYRSKCRMFCAGCNRMRSSAQSLAKLARK